jgi:vitamin B12 transporter
MRSQYYIAACAIALLATPALAQTSQSDDDVVVTASRGAGVLTRGLLGLSQTTISAEELETRQIRALSDVLRDVPGVAVNRSGGAGQLTQVRIRGAESNHTLTLIDGIEASDPFQGEFAFETLIADEVAKVEVIRGPQSALYGSQAIGGVISYITLSGAEAPGVRGRAEHGSSNSWDAAARVAGVNGKLDYAVSGGYQSTDGTPNSRFGARDLGTRNGVFSGRFVYALSDTLRVKAVGRYSHTKADFNDQDFSFPATATQGYVIDGDGRFTNKALYGLLRGEWEAGAFTHALSVQGVSADRDTFDFGAFSSGDKGRRVKTSYEGTFAFGDDAVRQTLTGVIDYKRETYQNTSPFLNAAQALKRVVENTGAALEYDLVANDRLGLGGALRYDKNELFDNATTWRAQASYRFDSGARLHAAGGSGVTNPQFYELFGFDPNTYVGNPNLKPERSIGWEAGAEQRFGDVGRIDVTYFSADLKDEIFTQFTPPTFFATPLNRATKSTRRGVEVSGEARVGESWTIKGAYTHLDAKENGAEEVRRPPNIASVNFAWRAPSDRFGAFVSARYNGETLDNNFTLAGPPRIKLASYTLVTLGGDAMLTDKVELYARIENAADEKYEDVYTYRTPGRAGYVGVKAKF